MLKPDLVIQWAKKTGDYAVLSHPDICVLALTYELDQQEKEAAEKAKTESDASGETSQTPEAERKQDTDESAPQAEESPEGPLESDAAEVVEEVFSESEEVPPPSESEEDDTEEDLEDREPLAVELQPILGEIAAPTEPSPSPLPTSEAPTAPPPAEDAPVYDDPSDEDDGEGEWITPSNVALHKSRALDLLPGEGAGRKGKKPQETIPVGCMTADFAMQNVLLQMGLGLVGVEGKRIERVKSWVLRCHACFKYVLCYDEGSARSRLHRRICKDASRKFCPACGNPSLLRASVTISSPNAGPNTPAMQVHLKKNFQFKTRGTVFSIPAPKPGSAKTGPGEGLILREDQTTYMRAKKHADGKREREEKRMLNAATKSAEMGQGGTVVSSWMDPDWVPEILSTGTGGKGRSVRARGYDGDMPMIGYGRKNPNERRKKK